MIATKIEMHTIGSDYMKGGVTDYAVEAYGKAVYVG